MKAEINYTGNLEIIAENKTELFALKCWIENSVDYDNDFDLINIKMGSFNITDNFIDIENRDPLEFNSLLDHVVENKQ